MEQALQALDEYLDLAAGRLEPSVEERARKVLAFADQRIRSGSQTVVALAGATGSGKSSLFNALSGTTLAAVAARRPTTSQPLALSFSATNKALLDLLRIPTRREAPPPAPGFQDVVLIDLPDHDSTELAHRAEVDRMVGLVDQFTFVVDPQKYADGALHERYLRPLAGHRGVITVVLNHADNLTEGGPLAVDGQLDERVQRVVDHLRTLLREDGLTGVPIFVTNALTGEGVPDLRQHLAEVAAQKRATRQRLAADLRNVAHELRTVGGEAHPLEDGAVEELIDDVGQSAGVERMAKGVRNAVRRKGAMLQGWKASGVPDQLELPSHQVASAADDARSATAVRRFVTATTAGLPELWREETRRRILAGPGKQLPARVDAAMRRVDLTDLETPFGWGLVRLLKWLPIVAIVGIAGFVVYTLVWGVGEFAPKLLTILGASLAAVILISLLGDAFLRGAARRAERKTRKRLTAAVQEEVRDGVITAVAAELDAHARAESALQRMTGILARG